MCLLRLNRFSSSGVPPGQSATGMTVAPDLCTALTRLLVLRPLRCSMSLGKVYSSWQKPM